MGLSFVDVLAHILEINVKFLVKNKSIYRKKYLIIVVCLFLKMTCVVQVLARTMAYALRISLHAALSVHACLSSLAPHVVFLF